MCNRGLIVISRLGDVWRPRWDLILGIEIEAQSRPEAGVSIGTTPSPLMPGRSGGSNKE